MAIATDEPEVGHLAVEALREIHTAIHPNADLVETRAELGSGRSAAGWSRRLAVGAPRIKRAPSGWHPP